MSVKQVQQEVEHFLKTKEPEVLCIMGKWGVGKTFAWRKFLLEAEAAKTIALPTYSYVSLFGVNSLEDLRSAIFENTVNVGQIAKGPDLQTLKNLKLDVSTLKFGSRFTTKVARHTPWVKDFTPNFFFLVKEQIICIDDLERMGGDISIKQVLGLISELKEQRKCKIVLLLNDEVLKGEALEDFNNQLEKVVDMEIKFQPTAIEAANIAIDKSLSFSENLSKICIGLDITNIRVIRKIQRHLVRLEELLQKHDNRIFRTALPTLVLSAWAKYQPKLAPPVEYLKTFNRYGHMFDDKNKETDEQKEWRRLISTTEFALFDEFDQLILESIERGFPDEEAIEKNAFEQDEKYSLQDKESSFAVAWEKYHNSFQPNEKDVLDELFVAFKKSVQSISPSNADGTISLFRKFGRDKEADELVEYYIAERKEEQKFYDPTQSIFLQIKDPGLKAAFEEKLKTFKDERKPEDVLIHIAGNRGWNPQDITLLASLSVNDYYDLFKKIEGGDLHAIVAQALKFKHYNPSTPEMVLVSEKAEKALKRIAKEGKINEYRIASYGVDLKPKKRAPKKKVISPTVN